VSGKVSAVGRFGLEAAPGGLRLAQDLVNTSLSTAQGYLSWDYLADLPTADAWLGEALAAWSAATGRPLLDLSLRERDLVPLRNLREQLRQSLRANAAHVDPANGAHVDPANAARVEPAGERRPREPAESSIRLTLHADGQVDYAPEAQGWQGLAGLISIEMLLAQAAGSLSRLKSCAAPICGACFFDGSPNRARVWHDTKVCGNATNLRASRASRKAR
ncbi:MAG TPA: CGNR zinc finger domain-containing protein, partial [Kribbella sp.]